MRIHVIKNTDIIPVRSQSIGTVATSTSQQHANSSFQRQAGIIYLFNMLPASLQMHTRQHIAQCARQVRCGPAPSIRRQPLHYRRTFATSQRSQSTQPVTSPFRRKQTPQERNAQAKRSVALSAAGMAVCAVAMFGVIKYYFPAGLEDKKVHETTKDSGTIKLDASSQFPITEATPLIVDGVEQVPTENSTIPYFPKTIRLPSTIEATGATLQIGTELQTDSASDEEYTLLGLGIRSVSFLSIQVYVVGLYIAKSDIPALQQRLVRQAASPAVSGVPNESAVTATSLVPGERDNLKNTLLDPEQGEELWGEVLKEGGLRTALRIVPTRNTDFLHLRDGWVRAITGRAQKANTQAKDAMKQNPEARESEFADDSFGNSMGEFKAMLGGGVRKNVPKGHTLLLLRDRVGALDVIYQQGEKKPPVWMGRVADERLSRLLWINYLGGKTVASEGARKNIVEGVMGIVGRPIGTVE